VFDVQMCGWFVRLSVVCPLREADGLRQCCVRDRNGYRHFVGLSAGRA